MPSENTNRLLTESYNATERFAAESSTLGREEWGKRFSLSNYLGEKLGIDPEQIFDRFNHFNEIYLGDSPLDQSLESARTIEGIQTNTPLPETKPSFVEETGKSLIRGTDAIISSGVAGVLSAMGLNEQALLVAKEANKVAETLAPHPEVSKELRRIRDEEGVLNQLLDWRWYATTGAELVPNLAVFAITGAGSMALSRLAFKATWAQIAVATATTSTQELFIESGSSISQLTGGAIEAENALEQLRSFPKSEQQALIDRGVFKSVQTYEAMIRAGSDPETAGRVASNTFKNDILITVAGTALGLTGGRIAVTKLFKGTKKKDIATALGAFGISLFKQPEEELRQDENIDSAILEEVFRIHVENNFFSSRTLDAILSGDKDKQDVALAAFFMGSKSAVVNLINDVSQASSLIDGERKLAEGVEQLRQNAKEADNIELQSYLDRYDKAETFEEKVAIWQEAAREVNDKNIDLINEQLAVDIEERVIADEQDQGKRKAANFLRQQEGLDLKFKKKDITNLDQFKADIRQQGGIQTANIEELAELPLTFKGKNGLTADEALEFAKELNLVPQDATDISSLVPLLKQKSTTEPTIAEKQIDKLTLGTAIDLEGGQRAIVFGTDTDGNTLLDIDGELVTQEPGTTLKGQFNEAGANEVERLIAEHGDLVEIEVSKNQEIIGSRTAQILGDLGINVIETDDFSAFSFDPDKTQVISREELDEIANSEAENASIFEEVNARVKALGFESERVVVIKTAQELPAKIKERARKQLGNNLGQIDGLFNPESGKVFIISGNIKRGRIDQTILHEVGGHLGLDALFGKKKLDKVLLQVFNGLTKKQKAETAAKYGLEEGILKGNLKAKKLNAEEFLAKIAEDPNPDPTILQKILAAIRQVLRDIGIVTKFSDNDIKVLLARAHKAARKATNKESLKVDSDIRFSKAPPTGSAAFKKWFGDSKVVDEDGEPLVVHHGTGSDFNEFIKEHLGSNFPKAGSAKEGFFFTDSKELAELYSNFAATKKVKKENEINFDEQQDSLDKAIELVLPFVPEGDHLFDKPKAVNIFLWEEDGGIDAVIPSNEKEIKKELKQLRVRYFELDKIIDKQDEIIENLAGDTNRVINTYLSIKNPLVHDFQGKKATGGKTFTSLLKKAKSQGHDGAIFKNALDPNLSNLYIAFEPTQIKSATDNVGTFDATNPDIRFSLKDSKEIERDVEIDIIGRLFKGGKVTQTDVKSALSKAGGNPLRAADILKGAKTANEILTERAKTLPDLNQLRGQLEQEIAEREKRGFVAGEFVEKARSRVRERVAAKKAEPTRAQLVNKKSSARAKLEKLKEEDGFELATEIESVSLDKIKPKTEKQKKAAEKAKAKAKEKKKSSEEDVLDPQNRDEILDQIGRPELPIAVLGTEQLSSITSTIKKAIPDPLEYKFAFSSALKAAAKKLTFGRDRETINNKIDAMEQLRKPETIDEAINDIIQRINKRRIRDNVDTLLNVFTRLLNSKKIKRKQSRTQELIKDDFHPHERRWLKLVRDVYKRGKVSIEEQLKKTEEFLNAPNAFNDLEKGKSFLFQAREFAPSTKDKFFESIPIEDFAKYYYKALSNYGAMQTRLPVDIAGAIFEIQEDIDTGIKKIEDEIFARNARLEKARNVFINAVDSKVRIRREGFSEFVGQFIQGVFSLRNRLIDSVRFGDSKKEKAAIDFITDLEERQTSANTKEQTEIRLALDRLSKGIEGIYKGRNADNVIHELKQRKDKFIKYSVDGVPLSKTNLLQIYGQLVQKDYEQQREAREKIFGKDYLKNILAELSAQDKALLDWLRQDAEFARVSLSKVSERVIGVPVVSPGENYLPAIMERDGGLPEEHVSPTLIPKALSLRVKNNLDIKESADILDLWSNRIRDNARFKNHVELNQDLRGVFAHPGVQRSIKLVHGERSLRDILFHVSDHMTGGVKETTKLAALDKIRGLVTLTQLSFNIGVMTRQITSIPAFGFRIGLGDVSKHLINFANPAKVEENIKIFKIIWNSEERKNRFQGGNEEQVSNALSSLNPNVFLKWLRMGMVTNSLGDIAPTMIIGSGIYRAEFEKNIRTMSEPQAKAKALNNLFTIVQATQQSKEQKDLAIWQRRLGVGGRFAGQFKSTQKQFAEFEVLAFREIIANHKSPKAIKQLLNVIAINHFLLPLAYNFVGALYNFALKGFPDEEEKEELLDRLVISMLAGPVSGLIVFGGFVETSIEGLVKGKLPFGKGTFPIERFEDLAVGIVLTLVNMAQFDMDEALKEFDRFLRGATPIYRDLRKFYKGRIEK